MLLRAARGLVFMPTPAPRAALPRRFDPSRTGRISLATLLHVLCEVDTPTALSVDEVNELLRMTGNPLRRLPLSLSPLPRLSVPVLPFPHVFRRSPTAPS